MDKSNLIGAYGKVECLVLTKELAQNKLVCEVLSKESNQHTDLILVMNVEEETLSKLQIGLVYSIKINTEETDGKETRS